MKTKTYHVKWEIDVEASSPKEAAEQALSIQNDNSGATVFEIYKQKEHIATVDLYANTTKRHKIKKAVEAIDQKWVLTDIDFNQYGRQLKKTLFEFKEDEKEATLIDLADRHNKEVESIINSFGYTMVSGENKVESLQNIDDLYGKDANWIIAECIFESE